jgi:hypothetical protein
LELKSRKGVAKAPVLENPHHAIFLPDKHPAIRRPGDTHGSKDDTVVTNSETKPES